MDRKVHHSCVNHIKNGLTPAEALYLGTGCSAEEGYDRYLPVILKAGTPTDTEVSQPLPVLAGGIFSIGLPGVLVFVYRKKGRSKPGSIA